MLPALKTANFADPVKAEDVRRLQNNLRDATLPLLSNPVLDGRMITGVEILAGGTTINHGLGRPLVGWFLVGISAQSTVTDLQAGNATPQLTLELEASNDCTVNLWVF